MDSWFKMFQAYFVFTDKLLSWRRVYYFCFILNDTYAEWSVVDPVYRHYVFLT